MHLIDRRLLGEVKNHPGLFGLDVSLNLFSSLIVIAQAYWLSRVITSVFLERQGLDEVAASLVILLGLILLRMLLSWGGETSAGWLAIRIKTGLRERLYQKLYAIGPLSLRQESTGEITHTLTEGIEALDPYFSQYLPQLFVAISAPLIILAFVFPLDALSGFIFLVTAPLIPFFMVLIGNLANALTRRQWQLLSRMSAYFLDVIQGLTTLKILGRSRDQEATLKSTSERYRQVTMRVLRVTFLSALTIEMLSTLSTAILAVEIGLRLLAGKMTFEPAFFILVLAPEFYLPLRQLGARFHAGMAGRVAAGRIFAILDTKPAYEIRSFESSAQKRINPPEIRFKNIHYAYPHGRKAIQGISCSLPRRKVTALVGPSGAGKSTLASLLLGFISPDLGEITINNLPAKMWFEKNPGASISWVPQNPYLFNEAVSANLRLGRPGATMDEVIQATRLANAHEFIQELPQGYETIIGERGQRLSSGQAQRLALARAFLQDAPILVIDEATSNLDPASERLVVEAWRRLAANRTVLVIAHRLSTAAQADQVIVMQAGQIVEGGSHTELIAQGGLYARMVGEKPFIPTFDEVAVRQRAVPGEEAASGAEKAFSEITSPAFSPSPGSRRTTLLRLAQLLLPFAGWISLSVLAGFLTVGSSVGLMATSAYIVSMAALQPSIAVLQVAIVGVRFFGLSRGLFRYAERLVSHETTFRILTGLRTWFYQKLEGRAPALSLSFHSGDLFNRIHADLASLESFFVRSAAPPLVFALEGLAAVIFLGAFHPWLGLALAIFLLAGGLGVPALIFYLGKAPGIDLVNTRSKVNVLVVDGIQGMADLTAFGQLKQYQGRIADASLKLATIQKKLAWIQALGHALSNGSAYLGMWTVLALTILLIQVDLVSPLALGVLALAALTSFEAALPLPDAAQQLGANLEAAGRLFEIADMPVMVSDPPGATAPPDRFSLRCMGLFFRYPGEASFRLEDIAFDLPEGKHLAIVGPSGSGKTTLLSLLLRLWDYPEGEIRLDDEDLRSFGADALRRSCGVVWQRTGLFNATLLDNLRLADPGASQEAIERACAQAQLAEFIGSLPQGFQTWIGEGGLLLSGGERQRLAIARALLKNPYLLILDEPTANLDPPAERAILQTLQDLYAGRSLLLVTHRLVGLEAFDEILVMENGRIIERGRHVELLARQGLYRQLWQIQNQPLL